MTSKINQYELNTVHESGLCRSAALSYWHFVAVNKTSRLHDSYAFEEKKCPEKKPTQ